MRSFSLKYNGKSPAAQWPVENRGKPTSGAFGKGVAALTPNRGYPFEILTRIEGCRPILN